MGKILLLVSSQCLFVMESGIRNLSELHVANLENSYCKGTDVGDAGFSLCGGLVKTTKSLSAFLSWFISSLLVDG